MAQLNLHVYERYVPSYVIIQVGEYNQAKASKSNNQMTPGSNANRINPNRLHIVIAKHAENKSAKEKQDHVGFTCPRRGD
jgi:hypothetical protein